MTSIFTARCYVNRSIAVEHRLISPSEPFGTKVGSSRSEANRRKTRFKFHGVAVNGTLAGT